MKTQVEVKLSENGPWHAGTVSMGRGEVVVRRQTRGPHDVYAVRLPKEAPEDDGEILNDLMVAGFNLHQ